MQAIRLLPGLDRFMMGKTFETICTSAAHHPVVVLVGACKCYYAMIINILQPNGYMLLLLDLTDDDMHYLSLTPARMALRGVVVPKDVHVEPERAFHKTTAPPHLGPFDAQLKVIRRKIVMPVLECLGLKVRKN
jgi:hypothetical protein